MTPPGRQINLTLQEGDRTILITFNRPVLPASLGSSDARSVFLDITSVTGATRRVPAEVFLQGGNVVQLSAGSPFEVRVTGLLATTPPVTMPLSSLSVSLSGLVVEAMSVEER